MPFTQEICIFSSRLCIISCIPVVNVLSLGQTYTVADKKAGISDDVICGAIVPLVGKFFISLICCGVTRANDRNLNYISFSNRPLLFPTVTLPSGIFFGV